VGGEWDGRAVMAAWVVVVVGGVRGWWGWMGDVWGVVEDSCGRMGGEVWYWKCGVISVGTGEVMFIWMYGWDMMGGRVDDVMEGECYIYWCMTS